MRVTCLKPAGIAVSLSHTSGSYYWEVLSIDTPQDGVSKVRVDIEIYEGIDLVKEAIKVTETMENTLQDTILFQAVLVQMMKLMTNEQLDEYNKAVGASHPGWIEDYPPSYPWHPI